jgi:hypothetical protein
VFLLNLFFSNFKLLKNTESKTVNPTNIISERDFANFDRLKREKPNANIVALEGLILFSNNKTVNWLNEMECEKKTEIIKIARENAPSILQQFNYICGMDCFGLFSKLGTINTISIFIQMTTW